MVVTIATSEISTLIVAFLSLPTTSKMLSMHEAFAEKTTINFSCTKRRLAPAKIDDKAAQASETSSAYWMPANLEATSPLYAGQLS